MQHYISDKTKIEILRYKEDGCSSRQIEEITGISKSSINRFLAKETYKEWWEVHQKPIASGRIDDHRSKIKKLSGKRFILTSAQNNTFVHEKFVKSLEVMKERLNAQIVVGTFSYNTNGFQNLQKSEGDWFDDRIKDYILDEPALLAEGLIWCGELNILPTAVNPLSGFHSYTKSSSGIIPHVKVQLESLPTQKNRDCRFLYTTGTVTKQNYIQKKAGQKAAFHHVYGALLVEVDKDGDWFVRQLICNGEDGTFYDLDTLYTPEGFEAGQNIEAINYGDIHAEKIDEQSFKASINMLDRLKPKYQFIHDVLDFDARNSHNIDDPYFRFMKMKTGRDSVEGNIREVCHILESLDRPFCESVVVESNHDLQLKRWLRSADYKNDPVNAVFFLKCQCELYEAMDKGVDIDKDFSIFERVVKEMSTHLKGFRFLRLDESFEICEEYGGIECGQHGHLGVNGGRGTVTSYQKLGSRYNVGHSHTATIKDGVYQAGVLGKLDMGYNLGGSSWSHSNIITYPKGKRTIITIKNGKWRA